MSQDNRQPDSRARLFAACILSAFFGACLAGFFMWLLVLPKEPAEPETVPVPPPVPPEVARPVLEKIKPQAFPPFHDDLDAESLKKAVSRSLEYFGRKDPAKELTFGSESVPVRRIMAGLRVFDSLLDKNLPPDELKNEITQLFDVYRCRGTDIHGEMMFTGYYEPLIQGSRAPSTKYPHPLYKRPEDMLRIDLGGFSARLKGKSIKGRWNGKTLVPYYSRKEIDAKGKLKGKKQELVWVKDPIDAFFLHIQGSGRVVLEDGAHLRVNYADQNGLPYKAVGGLLIREGRVPREKMSMQAIRQWLEENPKHQRRVFDYNPSYVFFRLADSGPMGCLSVPVTPGRSVAVDRKIFPMGALAWLQSQKPVQNDAGDITAWEDFGRFVLAQDTGGAIKGPGRLDLFWGHGEYAETAAGHMQHPGELYFLVLKGTS